MTIPKTMFNIRILSVLAILIGGLDELPAQVASDRTMLDFDSVVAFPVPELVALYRSVDPSQHIYYLLPTDLAVETDGTGKPKFDMVHHGLTRHDRAGSGAFVTLSVLPRFRGQEANIQAFIRGIDPNATFVLPAPVQSHVQAVLIDRFGREIAETTEKASLLNEPVVLKLSLTELGARVVLNALNEDNDLFAVRMTFVLRGFERGSNEVRQRSFSLSASVGGMCKSRPELFVDLSRRTTGCVAKFRSRWWPF